MCSSDLLNYHTGLTLDCMESICNAENDDSSGLIGKKRTAGSCQHDKQQQAKRDCKINEVFDLTEDDDVEEDVYSIESYEFQKSPDRAPEGSDRSFSETVIPDHDVLQSVHCEKLTSTIIAGAISDPLTCKQEQTDHDDTKSPIPREEEEEEELIYEDEEKEILFVVPVPKERICIDLMDDDDDDDNDGTSK